MANDESDVGETRPRKRRGEKRKRWWLVCRGGGAHKDQENPPVTVCESGDALGEEYHYTDPKVCV